MRADDLASQARRSLHRRTPARDALRRKTKCALRIRPLFLVLLLAQGPGCAAIEPARVTALSLETTEAVTHADLDAVLQRYVDARGLVDYRGLRRDPERLERYYLWVARESPDTSPDRFPTRADELAYWINAYNAAVLVTVLRYHPIASVKEVPAPFPLGLIDDRIGFFLLQRVRIGGQRMSLYALENDVIRERFADPRVHFALNCASRGCPQLPREAFVGARLEEQLDRETRRFFGRAENLRFDHEAQIVWLSPILDWYESDFTEWLARSRPGAPATLLEYVSLYVPREHEAALQRGREEGYRVDFVPYDWRLNDQGRPEAVAAPDGGPPAPIPTG